MRELKSTEVVQTYKILKHYFYREIQRVFQNMYLFSHLPNIVVGFIIPVTKQN